MPDMTAQSYSGLLATTRSQEAVPLPQSYNYIGIFLTFRCPYRCSYCINRFGGGQPRYAELSGGQWIDFFDRMDTRDIPVTLQGGEPGLHSDFVQIVAETLENHLVDILTNLDFDLDEFVDRVDPEKANRKAPYAPIRVSYHPEQFAFDDILRKVLFVKDHGFRVGLYGVLHPDYQGVMDHAAAVCRDLGVDFRTKPFLGWHKNVLYGEYAIQGVLPNGSVKRRCECAPTELLISPNGEIHRCHSFLYAGLPPLGHVNDKALRLSDEYMSCNRLGECNPCDVKVKNNRFQQFGHVAARIRNIE